MLAQRKLAQQATAWYQNYVALLRKLRSGHAPTALVTFCGQGGVSEGVRRANGAAHGQDLRVQPNYVRRFGRECFSQGDSTSIMALSGDWCCSEYGSRDGGRELEHNPE